MFCLEGVWNIKFKFWSRVHTLTSFFVSIFFLPSMSFVPQIQTHFTHKFLNKHRVFLSQNQFIRPSKWTRGSLCCCRWWSCCCFLLLLNCKCMSYTTNATIFIPQNSSQPVCIDFTTALQMKASKQPVSKFMHPFYVITPGIRNILKFGLKSISFGFTL